MSKKDKEIEREDNYKRTKSEIKDSVNELQGNINAMLNEIDIPFDQMVAYDDMLPSLEKPIEIHDYEKDIQLIKIESKETLECLANLYLNEDTMKNKNIYKIIKDDSSQLSDLNFSISIAKRSMLSCMRQIDNGVNSPEMYQSIALFQKEMRDTIKLTYDLQKKMKDFYRELKEELKEINGGMEEIKDKDNDSYTIIGDPKYLNDIFDKYKNDPSLLSEMLKMKDKL